MKTGNVKNVTAFGKLKGICSDLGASYNPSNESITLTALDSLHALAQQKAEAVTVARGAYTLALNTRNEAFAGISKLAARIVRAVKASEDGTPENVYDAKLIKRKLLSRNTKRKSAKPEQASTPEAPLKRVKSMLDHDGKIETFRNLVQLVQGLPKYKPNEADLQVAALKATLQNLQNKHLNVIASRNTLDTARIERDKVQYSRGGVYTTALTVKDYVQSVFGPGTDVSKQMSKIRFYIKK